MIVRPHLYWYRKINGQLYFRGDHIVPNFEEIWPSKKGGKSGRQLRGLEYYLDAMENGPQLSGRFAFIHKFIYIRTKTIKQGLKRRYIYRFPFLGFLPIPPNFTTVGKPQITVNQYDSPLDVYSDDTLEEMKEERLVLQNPDLADRMSKVCKTS